ncbi:MAG TPA: response regulator [Bryobacteraceae bacterium]|jgi:CheY-like chemotaxis protein|nr:response regulator [Bryobacteraceae bacterium]
MTTQVSENRSPQRTATKFSDATVLIVDDDEYFRALARTILEPSGFKVLEADGVAQCLSTVRACAVDAIILDMVMPDRDGMEALRELKTLYPATKILTVSGANDSKLFLNVSAYLGADASLDKTEIGSLAAMLDLVLDL